MSYVTAARPHRPVGVTVLVILLWVQALIGIAGGVILVILHHNRSVIHNTHQSASALLAIGIVALVIGVVTALIAYALSRGSNFARWIVALISALELAAAIYTAIRVHGDSRIGAIVNGAIALIILYILFGERGSQEYFRA